MQRMLLITAIQMPRNYFQLAGGGRKVSSIQLEAHLSKFFNDKRAKRQPVTYRMIKNEVRSMFEKASYFIIQKVSGRARPVSVQSARCVRRELPLYLQVVTSAQTDKSPYHPSRTDLLYYL
jgi:hypothetical protein